MYETLIRCDELKVGDFIPRCGRIEWVGIDYRRPDSVTYRLNGPAGPLLITCNASDYTMRCDVRSINRRCDHCGGPIHLDPAYGRWMHGTDDTSLCPSGETVATP